MECIVKTFAELDTTELYELLKARFAVFVVEQRCFYLDLDDVDYQSLHVFIRQGREVAAYARLFAEDGRAGVWHVGRVLTVSRGAGLGRRIMEQVVEVARRQGARLLRLDAQCQAVGFYERLGFGVCSPQFMEAGIPHMRMERLLVAGGRASAAPAHGI